MYKEKIKDTKSVIWSRKLKDRQYNDWKKIGQKDKQRSTQKNYTEN